MKTVFCAVLLCISFYSFSQAAGIASKDTLIQTDGTKYVGTITKTIINEDNTSEVEFVTEDGQKHNVPPPV